MLARLLDRLDRLQRRHRFAAFPWGVWKAYGEDRGGSLAALISYYGFFSLFPLLLVFVTVLGFVLEDDPDLRERILDSAFARFPVIGSDIEQNLGAISGNGPALVMGLLLALWAGLGVVNAAGEALNTVWRVPRRERPGFASRVARALATVAVFGIGIIAATALSVTITIVTHDLALAGTVLALLGGVAFNTGVLLATCRLLTARTVATRPLVPGAIAGGIGFYVLQVFGVVYVTRVVQNASDTYGAFAVVIGMFAWITLQANVFILSAEFTAVLHTRRWPRSLTGRNLTDADLRALEELAQREARVPDQHVVVSIDEP